MEAEVEQVHQMASGRAASIIFHWFATLTFPLPKNSKDSSKEAEGFGLCPPALRPCPSSPARATGAGAAAVVELAEGTWRLLA